MVNVEKSSTLQIHIPRGAQLIKAPWNILNIISQVDIINL